MVEAMTTAFFIVMECLPWREATMRGVSVGGAAVTSTFGGSMRPNRAQRSG